MIEPPRHPLGDAASSQTLPAFRGGVSVVVDSVQLSRGDMTLRNVSFSSNGGVIALLGPNGSGKTTLLRALATVASVESGAIRVDGLDIAEPENRDIVRSWLGYGPQATRFHPATRVFDALDYVATLRLPLERRQRQREVWRMIDEFQLRDEVSKRVDELSEGNRQRVTIAQAMLGPPRLVVLDEPLVALDPEIRLQAQGAIAAIARTTTVVMASHFVEEAAALADLLVVFARPETMGEHGRSILFAGTPDELAGLGDGRVWEAPPGTFDLPGSTSWRTETGVLRGVGPRPFGAEMRPPRASDGYLMLQRGFTEETN